MSPMALSDFTGGDAPVRETLRRRERIRLSSEFDRIFRDGRRFGSGDLLFRFLPTGLPYPRLGIAVGRAVGGSVERNLVKRRIREAFRRAKAKIERPADIVVVARRGEHSFERIASSFDAFISHLVARRPER